MKFKSLGIFGLFVALLAFMSVFTSQNWYDISGSTFWLPNNIENLLRRTAMYGLLGIGVAFVIITSGIDLSVGSVVCLAGCILAMFLRVDYQSPYALSVQRIEAKEQAIFAAYSEIVFDNNDSVYLSDTRRAKSGLYPLSENALLSQDGGRTRSWRLKIDGDLDRDDDRGLITLALPIIDFERTEKSSSITFNAKQLTLRPRDRVTFVHAKLGQKESEITEVVTSDSSTKLTLARDLGSDFSNEWYAIPKVRQQRMSVPLALIGVLGIAGFLGCLHGLLVTRLGLQPFVVTLCGLLIYRGLSRWLVNDQPVGFGKEYVEELGWLGSGKWTLFDWSGEGTDGSFGIPYPFFVLLLVAVLAGMFLNFTIWGRYLLAIGRNEEAARFSGIATKRYILLAYVICTVLAALGGILFAIDSNSVSPSSFGNFFELYAIAAAVLGGCSLRGGEGTIIGVVLGTAVMQILNNLILLMRISNELEFAIIGFVILVGVASDEVIRRLASRRKLSAAT